MKKLIFGFAFCILALVACGPSVQELKEKALAGDRQALIDWAETGDGEGMYALGRAYVADDRFDFNGDSAVYFYTKSVEAGYDSAMVALGDCYAEGLYGAEADGEKALELYKKAAEKGNEDAMVQAGYMLAGGYGWDADYEEAIKYFSQVKGEQSNYAQYVIADCYKILGDVQKALEYYQKAADAGYVGANSKMGALYLHDESVKDEAKSLSYYVKAAEEGDGQGCYGAGWFYEHGRGGVAADKEKAKEYYRAGAELGDEQCAQAIERLTPRQFYVSGHSYQGQCTVFYGDIVPANVLLRFYSNGEYSLKIGVQGNTLYKDGTYRQNGNELTFYPSAGNGTGYKATMLDNGWKINGVYGYSAKGTVSFLR